MNVARSARQERGEKTQGFACQLFTTVRYVYFTEVPGSVFHFCLHSYDSVYGKNGVGRR